MELTAFARDKDRDVGQPLELKDVGKKIKVGAAEVWSHVHYVTKAKQLASEANILITNNNLLSIRRQLPQPLLDLLDLGLVLRSSYRDLSTDSQTLSDNRTAHQSNSTISSRISQRSYQSFQIRL